jgi:hypothetical protein
LPAAVVPPRRSNVGVIVAIVVAVVIVAICIGAGIAIVQNNRTRTNGMSAPRTAVPVLVWDNEGRLGP